MLSSLRLTGSRLVLACGRTTARCSARQFHTPRALPYDIEDGLEPFLSPEALRVIAVDYQGGLLERLNDLIRGTEYEGKSIAQTVVMSARSAQDIEIFNTASQAINNDFFLTNLLPPKNKKSDHNTILMKPEFAQGIQESFGSLENLKSVVSATAMGMQSSGWVWLVADRRGELAALPTFGAGTLLVHERRQNQGQVIPINSPTRMSRTGDAGAGVFGRSPPRSSPTSGAVRSNTLGDAPPRARSLHASAVQPAVGYVRTTKTPDERVARTGDNLAPLFCISIHEHAWMASGLGVWGKEEYLRRFWTALDWSKVLELYEPATPISSPSSRNGRNAASATPGS